MTRCKTQEIDRCSDKNWVIPKNGREKHIKTPSRVKEKHTKYFKGKNILTHEQQ